MAAHKWKLLGFHFLGDVFFSAATTFLLWQFWKIPSPWRGSFHCNQRTEQDPGFVTMTEASKTCYAFRFLIRCDHSVGDPIHSRSGEHTAMGWPAGLCRDS